ncbi:hypothetical protein QP157_03860 [Sphingomonas sp. LR61]|uniref:hypothetical protein n=1 Tax=Sphingomonas sp. LR61 TaxID=3050234 RepID=UPI002FE27623
MGETIVLPAKAPRRAALEADGWVVVARSFGAKLDSDSINHQRLHTLIAEAGVSVRELGNVDVTAVLRLDAMTIEDYPGSVATQHTPSTGMQRRRVFRGERSVRSGRTAI